VDDFVSRVELRGLATIDVTVGPVVDLGGGRRYVAFTGGTARFRDRTSGVILDGGVDWQQMRPDGVVEIDAHYAIQTEQGEAIEVESRGLRKMSNEVAERLAHGDTVAPHEYYFRTFVRLRTAAPRMAWVNDFLAVSTGRRERDSVHLELSEVL
jgi:Protein of unknown function (DUF3237)